MDSIYQKIENATIVDIDNIINDDMVLRVWTIVYGEMRANMPNLDEIVGDSFQQ